MRDAPNAEEIAEDPSIDRDEIDFVIDSIESAGDEPAGGRSECPLCRSPTRLVESRWYLTGRYKLRYCPECDREWIDPVE